MQTPSQTVRLPKQICWLNPTSPDIAFFFHRILYPQDLCNEYQADILEQFEISKMAAKTATGDNRKSLLNQWYQFVMSNPLFGIFLQSEVYNRSKVMFNVMKTLLTLGSKVIFAIILN